MPGQLARPVMYNDSTIRHATYVEAILWPSSSQLRMYYWITGILRTSVAS